MLLVAESCWNLLLEEPCVLLDQGTAEAACAAGACLEKHSGTRKRNLFLL